MVGDAVELNWIELNLSTIKSVVCLTILTPAFRWCTTFLSFCFTGSQEREKQYYITNESARVPNEDPLQYCQEDNTYKQLTTS